jgi:hypothetical protein
MVLKNISIGNILLIDTWSRNFSHDPWSFNVVDLAVTCGSIVDNYRLWEVPQLIC